MPGFLLEDDAIAARQAEWDSWIEDRKRQADEAKRAAEAALKPVQQAVQPIQSAVGQATQQAVAPIQSTVGQGIQQTGDYFADLNAAQQARLAELQAWEQQRQQPAEVTQPAPPPTLVAGQPAAGLPSLSHAEEPATSTDTVAAPDLAGRWKTNFDFSAIYTGNYRTGTPHRGVDMVPVKGGIGTEVSAFHPGTVTQISRDSGAGGLMVYVRDDAGLTHTYMHLQGTAPGLKVGDQVQRGQHIAQMGESGTEGSPHLHYEVRKNAATGDPLDQLIDPRPYVAGRQGASAVARPAAPTTVGQAVAQVGQGVQDIVQGASDRVRGQFNIIQQAAQATGVPASIIASIMDTEAGGPRSESSAGAKGFMQVMPFHFKPGEDPFDPLTNIMRGAEILADNFKRWGAWDKAAAAYFGAIDALGNITGARDATGTAGPGYVARFQGFQDKYRALDQGAQAAGRAVGGAVESAVGAARQGATDALSGAVEQSGRAREQATSALDATRQLGDQLRREADEARTRYDQWQQEQRARSEQFSSNTQRMLSDAFQPVRESPALGQARQMAQDFAESDVGRIARNTPLPVPGGFSAEQIGQLNPDNLNRVREGILPGARAMGAEDARQSGEPLPLTAMRAGAGLVGGEIPEGVAQGVRQASRALPWASGYDAGGVIAAGLKGGGLTSTMNLPIMGDVAVADILGLASNFLIPSGSEKYLGAGTAASRTALSAASREGRQTGPMLGADLARGAMGQAEIMRRAISGAGRWARASVDDIADELSRSPVGDFMRDEAGELDPGALLQAARTIKQEVTRIYSGGPEAMAAGEAPTMGGGTTGISQSPTFLRESLRRMYPGAINKAAAKEAVQNSVDASRGIAGAETHVSVNNADKTISIVDQGKGMAPGTMEDVFVKLGGSSKSAGSSGGMGTAIKAIMANAEDTWVRTIAADPQNPSGFTDSVMHGSGDDFLGGSMHRYYARLGDMPDSELAGAPDEILNLGSGPTATGTAIWTKPMADVNWDPHTLDNWITHFNRTSRIPDQNIRFTVDGEDIAVGQRRTWDGRVVPIPEVEKPSQFLKTVSTPGAEIDFYGSGATAETQYADVKLLNNGQYQADQFVQLPGNAKMPTSLVADIRSTVDPKGVGYPWTADRNSLIDTAQKAIKDYIASELAGDLMSKENSRVGDTIRNAPKVGPVKLVDDAGIAGTSAEENFNRIPKNRGYQKLASIANDLHDNLIAELEGRQIHSGTIGPSRMVGLAVSDKWLGLNVPPSFTPWSETSEIAKGILIEPWQIWREVDRAWPTAGRDEQISRYADGLLGTMLHEISHNTEVGGHTEGFAGILTRIPQFLGSRMHQAIASEVRKRLAAVWDTLLNDLVDDAYTFRSAAGESSLERFGTSARGAADRLPVTADNALLHDQGGPVGGRPGGSAALPGGGPPEGGQPQPGLGNPNLAAAAPNAALGGAAGATSDEDLSPEDRLYRALGGAFVAGMARGKNPTVAAFEAKGLRAGATAKQIAAAVKGARETAGLAGKFEGPIADAVNAAFERAPTKEEVLTGRQFLRSFSGNLKQAAPPTAQRDSGMARLHNRLLEFARQGESQRYWYTNASEAIKETAQGDKTKGEKLAQLFAIYSPGATVSANTQMALQAWSQWLENVPIRVGKSDLDKKASALLYDNEPWDGRKTNNFYRNLMKRIDPDVWASWGREDGQTGTTVDIWMMRALQYIQDAPSMGKGGQYEFAQQAIERVAKELGWQPDEAQAAIWSAMKAANEGTGLTEAGYHYGTGLAERSAQVGGPKLDDIFRDEAGEDVLAKAAGLFGREGQIPVPAEKGSRTRYDAQGNPIYHPGKLAKGEKSALTEPIPEAKGVISAAAQKTIDAYAAARAYVQKLPEISWARVFVEPKPTQRDSNSLAVFLGRTITPEEVTQLKGRLGSQVNITETQDGAILVNTAGRHERTPGDPLAGQWIGESNVDFHKRANMALSETVEEASTSPFRAHVNTLSNDWEARPNGEDYAAIIGRSARSEAIWDVARPLAARAGDVSTAATAEPLAGAAGAAADVGGAANIAVPGAGNAATDLLSGGQPAQASAMFATRLGGGVGGVAASEATMSEEDKSNPLVRLSRDLSAGLLGVAAPGLAVSTARGIATTARGRAPSLDDLAQIRQNLGARQMNLPGTAGQSMTPGELISALGKQNLLAGAKSQLTNITSQMVELARIPTRAALAGEGDQALLSLRAGVHGIPDALKEFQKTWTSGISTTATPGQKTQPWLPIFRFIGATDDFFRVLGAHMGMATEAQRLVNESGAKTAADVRQVLQANEAKIFEAGQKEGSASVFQAIGANVADTQTSFGRWKNSMLASVAQSPAWKDQVKAYGKQGIGLLVDALVPFAGMPAKIWDVGLGRIPVLGEVRRFAELGAALASRDASKAQRALGELGIQSLTSSVILSHAFAGNVTGPDDKDHPSSVNLGGTWVDYSSWGAFQLPLAIPAAGIEAWRKTGNKLDAEALDYLAALGGAWGKVAVDTYYLSSLFDLTTSIGQGALPAAAARTIASYTDRALPSALNQAEQMIDQNVREVSKQFPKSVVDRVASRIPYLAETLPTQVEQTTGGARQREKQGPLGVLFGAETYNQPPIEREIMRLNKLGYAVSAPKANPTTVSHRGAQIKLTEAEQRSLGQSRGQRIEQVIGARMNSPAWDRMTDDQKAKFIARAMGRTTEQNVTTWRRMTAAPEQRERLTAGKRVAGRLLDQSEFGAFTAPRTAA